MTRRVFLASAAASLSAEPPRTAMGIATTSYLTAWRPRDTFAFLEHCHALGAGGIQSQLSSLEPADLAKLRQRAEQLGMYIEVMAGMPRGNDTQFTRVIQAAKDVGALCVRAACLGGRRYETFSTLEEWKNFVATSRASIARAVPIVEKARLPLALENHKDWTAEEFLALLQEYANPYFGVCLDTGNNIALLDDPIEFTEALSPYAFSTHIKDMAVAKHDEGFLLSEVPLGEGMLDMKRIVHTIRRARPETRMSLEMITRNPLRVPCLTDKFWATFPNRNGRYLARTLAMVHEKGSRERLLSLDGLDKAAQARLEEENVKHCLNYAREQLGL